MPQFDCLVNYFLRHFHSPRAILGPMWPFNCQRVPRFAATVGILLGLACAVVRAAPEKAVLEVAPTLADLGSGWTTNIVAYLLDPLSHPSEIDYQHGVHDSPLLEYQRDLMSKTSRSGCGMLLYGRGNLVMNSGLYRVHIQRWSNRRALHNAWVGYKMDPTRVVRDTPPIGEDLFWTNDWWRETLVHRNLVFRRGLFHIVVEAGPIPICRR